MCFSRVPAGPFPLSFFTLLVYTSINIAFFEHPRCYSLSFQLFTWHLSLSLEDNCIFSQRPLDRENGTVEGIMQARTCRPPAECGSVCHYVANCWAERFLLFTSLHAPAFNLGGSADSVPSPHLTTAVLPLWPSFHVIMLGAVITHACSWLHCRMRCLVPSTPGPLFRSLTDSSLSGFSKDCIPKTKGRRDVPKNLTTKMGFRMTMGHHLAPTCPHQCK